MNRPSALTVVSVVALLLAGCASFLAYSYLKKHGAQTAQGATAICSVVDLPVGARIEPSQVKTASWPREVLPRGAFSDARALAGRVAVKPITAGDLITEPKLMPVNVSGGSVMTYIVPQGHRAVTVAVNEVAGVAGFITPNSRVDVLLTIPRPGATDDRDNISKIILQNVPVLANGQVTEQKGGKPGVMPTVTLDVTPEDAEKLVVGTKRGTLQLLLRNVVDVASTETKGATVAKALGGAEAPPKVVIRTVAAPRKSAPQVVAVAAPPKFSMEVIKGSSKTTREFARE